jgi:hypothetical protein
VTARPVLALGLLAAAAGLAAPAASAAPRAKPPVCLLITDPAGDATVAGGQGPDAIDIVSADIATGSRSLMAVIRLRSTSTGSDATTAPGVTYTWSWSVGSVKQRLTLTRYAGGEEVSSFDDGAGGVAAAHAAPYAVEPGTITWTLPRKVDAALRKGVRLTDLAVSATASLNLKEQGFSGSVTFLGGDDAATAKPYTDLTPSCLRGV